MAGKTRNQKIPWDDIKKEYVEGTVDANGKRYYPSQPELCERYRVAASSIGTRASKEQWAVQREIFTSRLEEVTREKTIETISDSGSRFDLLCFNIACKSAMILDGKIDTAIANGYANLDDVKELSNALKNFQSVGRLALGLSTDNTKSSGSMTVVAKDLTRWDQEGG